MKPANPTSGQGVVAVTQADHAFASEIYRYFGMNGGAGLSDNDRFVQAAARHRLAHAKEQAAGVDAGILIAALESDHKPKVGQGDYDYLSLAALPKALREQAKDALFFEAEPHVTVDAWNIVQMAADELEKALAPAPASSVGEGKQIECPNCTGDDPAYTGADCPTCDGARWIDGPATPDRAPEHGELPSLVEALNSAWAVLSIVLDANFIPSEHRTPVEQCRDNAKAALQKLSASSVESDTGGHNAS